MPCSVLLYHYLQELIFWCYCSFYWCQELLDKLVSIQSKYLMFCLINDTTCILLETLNALFQFPARCNSIEETCTSFYCKLTFFELFIYLPNVLHNLKTKKVASLIILPVRPKCFSIRLPTSVMFLIIDHLRCCNWLVRKCFIQCFYLYNFSIILHKPLECHSAVFLSYLCECRSFKFFDSIHYDPLSDCTWCVPF